MLVDEARAAQLGFVLLVERVEEALLVMIETGGQSAHHRKQTSRTAKQQHTPSFLGFVGRADVDDDRQRGQHLVVACSNDFCAQRGLCESSNEAANKPALG